MKTYLRNVGVLDMRGATPEGVAQIERLGNAGVVLVSPATRALLAQMQTDNIGAVVEVPEDAELVSHNGRSVLPPLGDRPVYLLVNGNLTVAEDVQPDQLRAVVGGLVNGKITAKRAQLAALLVAGVQVNGKTLTYPDDARLRTADTPLTGAEVASMDRPPYLTRHVRVERGAIDAARAQGLSLYGAAGAIIDAADAEAFFGVWQGEGDVWQVPEGFTLTQGDRMIGAREAPLRGKRMIAGDVALREDIAPEQLAALDALRVTGLLFVPVALLDAVLGKLDGEPELVPYEGVLLRMEGAGALPDDLSALPGRIALWVEGVLTLPGALSPEALRERITLLYLDGVAEVTPAQQMALLPVVAGSGQLVTEDVGEEEAEEALPEGVQVMGNAAVYVVG